MRIFFLYCAIVCSDTLVSVFDGTPIKNNAITNKYTKTAMPTIQRITFTVLFIS